MDTNLLVDAEPGRAVMEPGGDMSGLYGGLTGRREENANLRDHEQRLTKLEAEVIELRRKMDNHAAAIANIIAAIDKLVEALK